MKLFRLLRCPFCGNGFTLRERGVAEGDTVATTAIVAIECPCGATWATEHGGRHYVGKHERDE